MIKLSRLTDYAVVILATMSEREGMLMSASVLSEATALPEPTVSKILKMLSKNEIIVSARGAAGGYALKERADRVSVSDIIAAMEGPIVLTACVQGSHESCAIENVCTLYGRWNVVNQALKKALDHVTLADMMPGIAGYSGETKRVSAYE